MSGPLFLLGITEAIVAVDTQFHKQCSSMYAVPALRASRPVAAMGKFSQIMLALPCFAATRSTITHLPIAAKKGDNKRADSNQAQDGQFRSSNGFIGSTEQIQRSQVVDGSNVPDHQISNLE